MARKIHNHDAPIEPGCFLCALDQHAAITNVGINPTSGNSSNTSPNPTAPNAHAVARFHVETGTQPRRNPSWARWRL